MSGTLSYVDDLSEVTDGNRPEESEAVSSDEPAEPPEPSKPEPNAEGEASPPSATELDGTWADFVDTVP